MGTTTKNLGLYKPAANDYYNVETDQNKNFDKIDEKFGKVDNGLKTKLDKGGYGGTAQDLKREIDGKEPAFSKKSGFNKDKTSVFTERDSDKLFTQEGANDLYIAFKGLVDTAGGNGNSVINSKSFENIEYRKDIVDNTRIIDIGRRLYTPTLFLDGIRIDESFYDVDLELGIFTLTEPYAKYEFTAVVIDKLPVHIRFSYPTLKQLQVDEQTKDLINLNDVIEIRGELQADDGEHRLVKCESSAKLNAVAIGNGKYLNEILNTRISNKVDKTDFSVSNIEAINYFNKGDLTKDGYIQKDEHKENNSYAYTGHIPAKSGDKIFVKPFGESGGGCCYGEGGKYICDLIRISHQENRNGVYQVPIGQTEVKSVKVNCFSRYVDSTTIFINRDYDGYFDYGYKEIIPNSDITDLKNEINKTNSKLENSLLLSNNKLIGKKLVVTGDSICQGAG
ncbi:hypothetical protein [Fusobacterium hominis]|uniref:hypothetical protein n=1 Tax=Fusobacterium hominis TaxID=2764326 RepID=UPI0022DED9C3|nr:hypothetical protein [Fusobacterium hominis]